VKRDEAQNFRLMAESPMNNELPWLLSGPEIPVDQKVDAGMHYNFARIHQTLRVTPAMEAGISNHVWSLEEIVGLLP
jgi:hypothetical protein